VIEKSSVEIGEHYGLRFHRALRLQEKAVSVGFDWEETSQLLEKLSEEIGEIRAALEKGDREQIMDEIGDLSASAQAKLLRSIETGEVEMLGTEKLERVDVRIIAATNRDLEEEMKRGAFRTDLYYRLNVITLHLPLLRDRKEDIPLLAQAFLERVAKHEAQPTKRLTAEALDCLLAYDWPGNVRELENALEHAAVLSRDADIEVGMLPERIRQPKSMPLVSQRPPENPTLEVIERAYITWVLQAEGGNKTRAAEILGIDPSTLYRKLARYEADPA